MGGKMVKYLFFLIGVIFNVFIMSSCNMPMMMEDPAAGYKIHGFIGKSTTEAAVSETVTLIDTQTGKAIDKSTTNYFGKYSFKGLPPGKYQIKVDRFSSNVFIKNKSQRLDFDLSAADGKFDYMGSAMKDMSKLLTELAGGSSAGYADPGPNDPALMQWIAGYYYGYSSSGMGTSSGTETKIMLCPDGTFRTATESGYSGTTYAGSPWLSGAQGGDHGRWSIQGTQQSGTMVVVSPQGDKTTYEYSACGNGCFYFGQKKFGYAGPPQCP
jgi:hypothetical protein